MAFLLVARRAVVLRTERSSTALTAWRGCVPTACQHSAILRAHHVLVLFCLVGPVQNCESVLLLMHGPKQAMALPG
eukprot:6486728-Amphidinium_carterae.1